MTSEIKEHEVNDGKVEDAEDANKDATDPYAYLERGDFSSEIFKLELSNLPKKFGIAQLRKKLIYMKLKPCKIKSIDQGHYAFVTFRSEEDRTEAINVLQGHVWKSKPIRVKMAAANADPFLLKRKRETENEEMGGNAKKLKEDSVVENISEKLNDIVTPLWKIPYDQQLENKSKALTACVKRLTKDISNVNEDFKFLIADRKLKYGGLCCQLHPIKPSPITSEYRNKCEFTIGTDSTGTDRIVGFRFGSYRDGDLTVAPVDDCINIPPVMKIVLKELQSYLTLRIDRPSFNPCTRKGFWKHALVRTSSDCSEVLLSLVAHPQQLSEEEMEDETKKFKNYYEDLMDGKKSSVTSLYFQFESDRKERFEEGFPIHLLGNKFIQENLLQLKFQISPLSFFQVNTPGAEMLYTLVSDMCKANSNVILIDACCGTGTIGLTMADKVKKVIGIELSGQAINDARTNASLNGVTNVEYVHGKVEDVLPNILKDLGPTDEAVIVVDPPRAGLHSDVVRSIRRVSSILRLVYVSCKLTAALQNIVDLTRQVSKRVVGKPFHLMEVFAVDMFPHTEHYETVLLLERQTA